MMNLSFLSPKTIACIARGAVRLEQSYYYHSHGWSNHYHVRVAYPNGYGVSIVYEPELSDGESDIWEAALLNEDGELYEDADGMDCVWSNLTEEDVIRFCDRIYFLDD